MTIDPATLFSLLAAVEAVEEEEEEKRVRDLNAK